jgi:hypothetical protein
MDERKHSAIIGKRLFFTFFDIYIEILLAIQQEFRIQNPGIRIQTYEFRISDSNHYQIANHHIKKQLSAIGYLMSKDVQEQKVP